MASCFSMNKFIFLDNNIVQSFMYAVVRYALRKCKKK